MIGPFEVAALAIVAGIISKWFKAKGRASQSQLKELEQRIQALEAQQAVKDLQKRIGVLEEIFVTEDFELQRKLHYALGSSALTASSRAENQSNPKENLP